MNFISWVSYALQNKDAALLRVNAIGCGFAIVYLAVFLTYSRGKTLQKFLTLLTAASVIGGSLWAGISYGVSNLDDRILGLGVVAVACNVIMYAAPINAILTAMKENDPDLIPILLTVASTFLSACWLIYGLLVDNWFVAGPNVAGTLLCLAQLIAAVIVKVKVMYNPELLEQAKTRRMNRKRLEDEQNGIVVNEEDDRATLLINE